MNITIVPGDRGHRMVVRGSITQPHSRELEAGIIDAMRRYAHLKVDLSEVREIDRRGLQLLRLMQAVGGKEVDIVATSPAVDRALAGPGQHLNS